MQRYDYVDMRELIRGYQQFVLDYIGQGWTSFEISFMFHQLAGTCNSHLAQMRREIERVYARLLTRVDRNPRSPAGFGRLPRMILFPDLPVYKREKKSLKDVAVNNGLHYGGIALTPPASRFHSHLDLHFAEDQLKYVNDKLERVWVGPIVKDADYVTDYVAKSVKRRRVSHDDIIILPKSIRELPSKWRG